MTRTKKSVRDMRGRCLGVSLLVREESEMAARDEESWAMSMDIGDSERTGRMAHTQMVHFQHVQRGPLYSCLFG